MRHTIRLAKLSIIVVVATAAACGAPPPEASTTAATSGSAPVAWSTSLPKPDLFGCAPAYDVAVGNLRLSSAGGCNLPAIIHIHGGGWYSGAASDMDAYRGAELFNHIVYVSVDYPLYPAAMSTMLASVHLAIDFLRTQHDLLGIDPNRIGLIGESAGGQLALQAGIDDGDLRFIGSLFGPPDMRAEESNFCVTFGGLAPGQVLCAVIHSILGGTPAQAPQSYDAASPIVTWPKLATHQQAPYFYFGESIGDLLVPVQTVDALSGALGSHGLPVLDDRIPGDAGVVGHNLGPDKINFLRARAILDAVNAMNGPALPPPSIAPPSPSPGAPPPPAPPPPSSCTCACSGQIGLATAANTATGPSCDAARAAATPVVQNALFLDVLAAGPPWTLWYTEAAGIPVNCQCQ